MKPIKTLSIIFILAFLFACDSSGGGKSSGNNEDDIITTDIITTDITETEDEEVITETENITNESNVSEIVTIDEEIPIDVITEEEDIIPSMPKTLLYYDGSLKEYDGITITKLFDCNTCIKAGDYYFTDYEIRNLDGSVKWDIPEKAVKACLYDGKLFYYTENNNLYMCEVGGESELIANNQYSNHSVVLTENGIRFELYFYNQEGTPTDGQFVGYDNIFKIEKVLSDYKKYWYDGNEFVQVGNGLYSEFVRWHSLNINGIDYYTSGAIFDRSKMKLKEPVFDSSVKIYKDGSCFNQFIQPPKIVNGVDLNTIGKPHFIGIGVADNKGYFLCAKDGRVYIFDPALDTITKWIKIVEGTLNDDRTQSFALFDRTNAYIFQRTVIYFDGIMIKKVDIDTGLISDIASATSFKGYNY